MNVKYVNIKNDKKYYKDNKGDILNRQRKQKKIYYIDNKTKLNKKHKKYYEDNKNEIQQKHKEYYKTPHGKLINFNNNSKRKFKEKQGRGITTEQWKECMNFFNWNCAYSGEKLQNNKSTYGRTLDHILALNNGGMNEPWNVIPMRKGYNSSKSDDKYSLEWYMYQPYFSEERLNKITDWQMYAFNKWGTEDDELVLITELIDNEVQEL